MTQLTNLASFNALKEKLDQDEVIVRYRQLAVKVHQNERLLNLYDEYLQKQKELTNLNIIINQERRLQWHQK